MGHNLGVLEQGVGKTSFAHAGMNQASNDYIHPDREDETIAYTAILGPGEEETITFTAPAETGDYDYICTFPGHTAAGMVGVMTVEYTVLYAFLPVTTLRKRKFPARQQIPAPEKGFTGLVTRF